MIIFDLMQFTKGIQSSWQFTDTIQRDNERDGFTLLVEDTSVRIQRGH